MKKITDTIEKIVSELLVLEPALESKAEEVRRLVLRMMESRPEVLLDDTFIADLRRRLLSKGREPVRFNLSRLLPAWGPAYAFAGVSYRLS